MQYQAKIADIQAQLQDVQNKLNAIEVLLLQKAKSENMLGDWISKEDAIALTGLKKTRLYQLRVAGKIKSSTLGGKAVFYSLKSLRELIDTNSKNR